MKIAYFTNQYPMVSHTFIRREICALDKLGLSVSRYAIRTKKSEIIDPEDIKELERTQYILDTPIVEIALILVNGLFKNTKLFFTTLFYAIKLGRHSDQGIIKHLFYFIEACILAKWLKQSDIEHVHAHFATNPATIVMLAHRLGGPTYSFTTHGPEEFDKPLLLSLGEKIAQAKFVAAISSFTRSQLYRWSDYAHWNKIKVIHCGIDDSFFDDSLLSTNTSKNLVCVGRLCEQKGQLLIVQAISELIVSGEDIYLTLAGDGPMRVNIEQLIEKYNVAERIKITGWISNKQVREELLSSRALILPSFAEGLPVVIMEAMALQRPVISTYIAGIPELVIAGENGWLIPASNNRKLKEAVLEVLSLDKKSLETMGKKARLAVMEQHNIDTEAKKLYHLFTDTQ